MAKTDDPLKSLFSYFTKDFASWLLGEEVKEVHSSNVNLPSQGIFADEIFEVTLANGQHTMLHIDFQGRRTHRQIEWRMLDYLGRIAEEHRTNVCSVVIYVGKGAGSRDKGRYEVKCPNGDVVIAWQYRVIHLWKMKAEELVSLDRPALLALIGQTQIEQPKALLPQVVNRIRETVSDEEMRGQLLTALVSLMNDKEMATMVTKMLAKDELLLDTPFLRTLRQKCVEEGLEEGLEKGLEKGTVMARRHDILEALTLRFAISVPLYRQIDQRLLKIADDALLEKLFAVAIQGEDTMAFQAVLDKTELSTHCSSSR